MFVHYDMLCIYEGHGKTRWCRRGFHVGGILFCPAPTPSCQHFKRLDYEAKKDAGPVHFESDCPPACKKKNATRLRIATSVHIQYSAVVRTVVPLECVGGMFPGLRTRHTSWTPFLTDHHSSTCTTDCAVTNLCSTVNLRECRALELWMDGSNRIDRLLDTDGQIQKRFSRSRGLEAFFFLLIGMSTKSSLCK